MHLYLTGVGMRSSYHYTKCSEKCGQAEHVSYVHCVGTECRSCYHLLVSFFSNKCISTTALFVVVGNLSCKSFALCCDGREWMLSQKLHRLGHLAAMEKKSWGWFERVLLVLCKKKRCYLFVRRLIFLYRM